jgi:biopolymer transport protein ExbB/TolQ
VLQGQIDKAISVVSQIKSPLTDIMRAGLISVQNGKDDEEVQTSMDAVALREIPRIQARVGLLSMLANLATLVGLLGTVSGMIGAFSAVANVAPAEKATLLSNAIGEALNCTAFGLLVAIPLLGSYGWINSWSQKLVDDIHESSVATLNFILSNRDKIAK